MFGLSDLLSFTLPSISLPTIPLPANIQRHILSFLLRRTLGHFVKPGQLDINQIEAQISGGKVEIKDVELDPNAINALIDDLPVRLHEGAIGKVAAQFPFPNILTAPFSLALSSLHLTLELRKPPPKQPTYVDLERSVTSVAEEFVHDLTDKETQALKHSIYGLNAADDDDDDRQPPGSINPYLDDATADDEDPVEQLDFEGASVFAAVVERLLSRFSFTATDVRISVIHPGETQYTLQVPDVHFATEEISGDVISKVRTIKVSGVVVSSKRLQFSVSRTSSQDSFPDEHSSGQGSSEDEDIPASMYESTASILTSSMYHSAASVSRQHPTSSPTARLSPIASSRTTTSNDTYTEEIILSLVYEPIIIQISNSLPADAAQNLSSEVTGSQASIRNINDTSRIVNEAKKKSHTSVEVSLGVMASALKDYHLQAFISSVAFVSPPPTPVSSTSNPEASPRVNSFSFSLKTKGLPLVLLQDPSAPETMLSKFYAHPVTTVLQTPHLRVYLDTIELAIGNGKFSPPSMTALTNVRSTHSNLSRLVASLGIADLSVFTIYRSSGFPTTAIWTSAPLVIRDERLAQQYDPDTARFPVFEVPDSRKPEGMSIRTSKWKIRAPSHFKHGGAASTVVTPQPVLSVRTEFGGNPADQVVEISVEPLSVFVDLSRVTDLMALVPQIPSHKPSEELSDVERLIPNRDVSEPNLETPRAGIVPLPPVEGALQHKNKTKTSAPTIVINTSMIRLQVRAPPPPAHSPSAVGGSSERSGCLVLDIHGLRVVTGDNEDDAHEKARFVTGQPGRTSRRKTPLATTKWKRIIVGFAGVHEPRASTLLSIGPAVEEAAGDATVHINQPTIHVRKATATKEGELDSISLECHIPSVAAKLDKPALDGLQFWADDCAQWAEKTFGEGVGRAGTSTGDTSLIGSRYFARTPEAAGSLATISSARKPTDPTQKPSEIVISLHVAQATISLLVPRGPADGPLESRPFHVSATDIDILTEVKPEGRDETVISLGVTAAEIVDKHGSSAPITFLELTNPSQESRISRAMVKLRITSLTPAGTTAKQSIIQVTLSGFTYTLAPDISWVSDIARYAKAPPGAFESVVPSEKTCISLHIHDGSLRVLGHQKPGSLVVALEELKFDTELITESPEITAHLRIPGVRVFFIDEVQSNGDLEHIPATGVEKWQSLQYALLAQLQELDAAVVSRTMPMSNEVNVEKMRLRIHLCADTGAALGAWGADLAAGLQALATDTQLQVPITPTKSKPVHVRRKPRADLMSSIDEDAFKAPPEVDIPGDMMRDDLPTNLDYLDAVYSASGGINAYSDDDEVASFSSGELSPRPATPVQLPTTPDRDSGVLSNVKGEIIRILSPGGFKIIEDFYDTVVPVDDGAAPILDYPPVVRVRVKDSNVFIHLHDGYDWVVTRKAIEEEARAMRRKLLKIRQLLASGQVPDETVEETHAFLFNSIHIGLPDNVDEMDREAIVAALDEELADGDDETASQTSWQSVKGATGERKAPTPTPTKPYRVRGKKLTRSKHSRIDVCLYNMEAEFDKAHPQEMEMVSRVLLKVKDLQILDHIKTSTWKTFLTELKTDSKGNIREAGSDMVKIELKTVKPVQNTDHQEARLRMKFLPLKLHVDQDALDFLKAFGAFQVPKTGGVASPTPAASTVESRSSDEIFFQRVEVFPIDLKLDYKPKRVDYKALKEGRTIELMNFFHFDGAEMTLRHIELSGIQGWATLGDTLNDLWTPDVKANQMIDVISGISPIRSVVNVGSGLADLILLPIAQYKKDGRLVRGLQKGANSFAKTTALEAVKLGAKLATGTQVILEQAENILGGSNVVVAEPLEVGYAGAIVSSPPLTSQATLPSSSSDEASDADGDMASMKASIVGLAEPAPHMISRYADQPNSVREGVEAGYRSMGKNLNSAAQTILAVPMEVYERSGNEGAVRKVIRAVPIAVLKPMIGATEAVSKTLLGLRNTLDPENLQENEEKYKR